MSETKKRNVHLPEFKAKVVLLTAKGLLLTEPGQIQVLE